MSRSALITGASKGIGASIVRSLVASTPDISRYFLVARKSPYFERFIEELRGVAPSAEFVPAFADLGEQDQVDAMIEQVSGHGGNVDVIINNAAYTNPRSINEITRADFLYTLQVNLMAPFSIVQGLIRAGRTPELVINIASTAGITGRPGWLTYSASKAGLINMSEVMREELKPYGTRVVCISPGRCATDLRRALAPDEDPTTIMQPEDVGRLMSVLVSDLGRLIDSQNIVVRT